MNQRGVVSSSSSSETTATAAATLPRSLAADVANHTRSSDYFYDKLNSTMTSEQQQRILLSMVYDPSNTTTTYYSDTSSLPFNGGLTMNHHTSNNANNNNQLETTTLASVTTTGTASSANAAAATAYSTPARSASTSAASAAGASATASSSGGAIGKAKIGHREIKDGVVHYKKVSTDELKKAIQFGIVHFINEQNRFNMDRDLLMQDFQVVETVVFPKSGSPLTPAHDFNDFKLKVYAPYGFRYLRRKFNVNEVDFMHALGETELKEVSNPGASGSVFYKTSNDKYILKTVQYQECEFLKTLLAGYTLNLLQNLINQKFSLLPTIYGLFCYQRLELTSMLSSDKTNIRVVIMNNILPSDVPIHEKYDLKGSLYKRKASRQERSKNHPTFKDLDFLEQHPEGLQLDEKHYDNIISSIKRDCMVLESFGIMDYSLLLGIHNLEKEKSNAAIEAYFDAKLGDLAYISQMNSLGLQNSSSMGQNLAPNSNTANQSSSASSTFGSPNLSAHYSNLQSSLVNKTSKYWDSVFNISAVPARSGKGERLLLYFGIIDILQSYKLKKRLEHTFKSMITDGRQISVCHPKFYSNRFIEFMTQKVFKKATLKGSPIRKRLTFKLDNKKGIAEETSAQTSPISEQPPNELATRNDNESSTIGFVITGETRPTTTTTTTTTTIQSPTSIADYSDRENPRRAVQSPTSPNSSQTYNPANLKSLKAIDSVDSVSGILSNTTPTSAINTNRSRIDEDEDEEETAASSSREAQSHHTTHNSSYRPVDYSTYSNDNDTSVDYGAQYGVRRAPIRVIDHYSSKTTTASMGPTSMLSSSNNNMTTTSPISIKIETHSPVHLKSTSNLYADSTLSTSSSLTTTPNHHQYQQQQQQIRHIPILPAQQTPNAHSQSHSQQQSPTNSSSSSDQKFNVFINRPVTSSSSSSIVHVNRYSDYYSKNNNNNNNAAVGEISADDIEIITHL